MDDSFAYRTTVPVRRELDPRLIRAATGALAVLVAIVLFATWVISSEQRSFEQAPAAADAPPSVAAVVDETDLDPDAVATDVEEALRLAADAARAIAATDGTFVGATPLRLGQEQRGYTYVDGPSSTVTVVSVASTRRTWAAAVLGADGACGWIVVAADASVTRTAGTECTGAAALASIATR